MAQEPILEPVGPDPVRIVPAEAAYEATRVVPQVSYQAVVPPAVQPVAPVVAGPTFVEERRPAWPYFVALAALLIGGAIGFLIGDNREKDQTDLTATTQSIDSAVPTSVGSDPTVAQLQDQIAQLTADQTKATQDLADAQAALVQAQAERDTLAAQVGSAGGTTTGLQAQLDASKAQVTQLQNDAKTAATQLDAANTSLAQTQASLQTVQGQLDAANTTLTDLHPIPLPNYVGGAVAKATSDAQANGWTVIQEPGTSSTAAVGTVLEQTPAATTTVVAGSVLLLKVKQAP